MSLSAVLNSYPDCPRVDDEKIKDYFQDSNDVIVNIQIQLRQMN